MGSNRHEKISIISSLYLTTDSTAGGERGVEGRESPGLQHLLLPVV